MTRGVEVCYIVGRCACVWVDDGRSSVYGTVALDGVFDGVIELADDQYSVERADRYLRHAGFPSIIYRHSDITGDLINSTLCLADLLHASPAAASSSSAAHQPQVDTPSQKPSDCPPR